MIEYTVVCVQCQARHDAEIDRRRVKLRQQYETKRLTADAFIASAQRLLLEEQEFPAPHHHAHVTIEVADINAAAVRLSYRKICQHCRHTVEFQHQVPQTIDSRPIGVLGGD